MLKRPLASRPSGLPTRAGDARANTWPSRSTSGSCWRSSTRRWSGWRPRGSPSRTSNFRELGERHPRKLLSATTARDHQEYPKHLLRGGL